LTALGLVGPTPWHALPLGSVIKSSNAGETSDEHFAEQVAFAEAEAIKTNLEVNKKASYENWAAAAWLLERRHPDMYAKPEIQLNVQNNLTALANGSNLESLVVSDLEFLGLRHREGYEHRARDVWEVDTEVVPVDLSGTLSVKSANGRVISQSQADDLARRFKQAESRVEALLAAKQSKKRKS
jgi:hypothetical protein